MLPPKEELEHVRKGHRGEAPPAGLDLDQRTYPGGSAVLERAREVMAAVLTREPLPDWFTAQCVDDAAIRDCEVERWSLRAWKYWLEPENRRWWWWSAEADGELIRFTALVTAKPYLKGSIDWLFEASLLRPHNDSRRPPPGFAQQPPPRR